MKRKPGRLGRVIQTKPVIVASLNPVAYRALARNLRIRTNKRLSQATTTAIRI